MPRQFTQWARAQEDIRLALVVGSRARTDRPADECADLNVVVVTPQPERHVARAHWVEGFGCAWLTFAEPTARGGQKERRVVFGGGLDVDFSVVLHRGESFPAAKGQRGRPDGKSEGEPLAERIWALSCHHGPERLQRSGLTLEPATKVSVPIVRECRAHLECVFVSAQYFGPEVLIFGRMVAATIDADCLGGRHAEQYFSLRPLFFLEEGLYASIAGPRLDSAGWARHIIRWTYDHPEVILSCSCKRRPGPSP